MVSAELKVVGGKHAGQVIPLNRRKFLIGREQDCQLRPNSEMVSRHHCVFSVDDFSVRLRDLGSTNGTLVNGERIRRETVLNSGDRILIGNLDFELVLRPGVTVQEADSKVLPTATALHSDTQTSAPTVLDASAAAPATPSSAQTVTLPLADIVSAAAATTPPAVGATAVPAATPQPDPAALAAAMQPQFPYPPMMPPMGYPGAMYPGYPYQQPMMPGYGQMYPPMMPLGYPMQPQVMPQTAAPAAPTAPAAATAIEVSLPDPATTGARESEAPKGSTGAAPKDTAKPTGAADAIIKQYMRRRPGTPG
ncbi:MAG: FHA domain-containing protein [Planctomycetaceae bacterium]